MDGVSEPAGPAVLVARTDAWRASAREAAAGPGPAALVLGIAQDAGYPQAGCSGDCCQPAWLDPSRRRHAAALALIDDRDREAGVRRWLIDATPDLREQLHLLDAAWPPSARLAAPALDGIFLTHAHIGHYPGLWQLGPEAMAARGVPVYAMPRMAAFLKGNLPWSALLEGGHLRLEPLAADWPVALAADLSVTPLPLPHRDEHSETVGFLVRGPRRRLLYLPDIDGWEAWEARGERIEDWLAEVDLALGHGTFFDADELPGRDLSRIPHPTVAATLRRLADLPAELRARLRFTHLNHSNPMLRPGSGARRRVIAAGFGLAEEGQVHPL